jgi:hypothetical protein
MCTKFRGDVFSATIIPMYGERLLTEGFDTGWAYDDKRTNNIALCVPRLRKSFWWDLLEIQRDA